MTAVPDKFLRAITRRDAIRRADTNCLRLIDGAGDGFPDLFVDDLAGRWLVQTRGADLPAWVPSLAGPRSIYWKRLDQTAKQAPAFVAGEQVAAPFPVMENGLTYLIDFSAGYSQGLFLDQRE